MILAANQPCFMPWLGFFDLIMQADVWISLDTFQLPQKTFVTRNRVCRPDGSVQWISASLVHGTGKRSIQEARLEQSNWWLAICNKLEAYYRKALFFPVLHEKMREIIKPRECTLAAYNERTTKALCALMEIDFAPISLSSLGIYTYDNADALFIRLCKKYGAERYYNFKNGVELGLHKAENYEASKIRLYKHDFQHPAYQQHTGTFVSHMSVLDALYNIGPQATREMIQKGSSWKRVRPIT